MKTDRTADRIITNGKILTVDEEFTVAQALAISGEHIMEVGGADEIERLRGPDTIITDVEGRTVIPGLIDNHVHFFRGVPYWRWEAFFDAVDSRTRALELVAEKAAASAPGEWVLSIGGWDPLQFKDSSEEFTRRELDQAAPNNPTFVQHGFTGGVANSLALKILEMDSNSGFVTSEGSGGWKSRYGKNSGTGIPEAIRQALPGYDAESWKENYLKPAMEDYSRAGVTCLWDAGGILYPNNFQQWARERVAEAGGWSNLRIFANIKSDARNAEAVDRLIDGIREHPELENNDYFRVQGFGEMLYHPAYEVLGDLPWKESDDASREYLRLITAAAEKRWQIIDYVMYAEKFDWMLDMFEDIDREIDIKPLRWSPHHCYAFRPDQFERAAKLNL
ncbi:MAG: amidohydrolase family protein, partial [Rhodospirillales bacterium]|nr:amidohydrolase family protein [Rhodospirillales bacterium]